MGVVVLILEVVLEEPTEWQRLRSVVASRIFFGGENACMYLRFGRTVRRGWCPGVLGLAVGAVATTEANVFGTFLTVGAVGDGPGVGLASDWGRSVRLPVGRGGGASAGGGIGGE